MPFSPKTEKVPLASYKKLACHECCFVSIISKSSWGGQLSEILRCFDFRSRDAHLVCETWFESAVQIKRFAHTEYLYL